MEREGITMNLDELNSRKFQGEKIVRDAGAMAARFFRQRETLAVESKGLQDFVSEADRAVESFIRSALQELWPDDHVFGEEFGCTSQKPGILMTGFTWVIDPIDGTGNFIRGIPMYCVLLALVCDGETVMGFSYDPERDEMFMARKGRGATLNGQSLTSKNCSSLQEATIAIGSSMKPGQEPRFQLGKTLLSAGVDYRRLGSAGIGLAWAAAGRVDGFFEGHLNSWDALAGILLNREMGNEVLPVNEGFLESGGSVLVSSPELYQPLVRVVT